MSCLYNFLIRFIQIYGITLGFTYVYVDIENSLVKFYTSLKIYVYFINIITYGMVIVHLILTLMYEFNYAEIDMGQSIFIMTYLTSMCLFLNLILLRIREEQGVKKWSDIIPSLQKIYFDKFTYTRDNQSITKVAVINFLIIFAHNMYNLYNVLFYLFDDFDIWNGLASSLSIFFIDLPHYILLHHGFILLYINDNFSKLNDLLKHGHMIQSFVNIYLKFSLLLQEVNSIYGSTIFIILLSQIVPISLFGYGTIELLYGDIILTTEHLVELIIDIFLIFNMFLYSFICEQIYGTSEDTGRILKNYSTRAQNSEVC